jgi:hypothetical protein
MVWFAVSVCPDIFPFRRWVDETSIYYAPPGCRVIEYEGGHQRLGDMAAHSLAVRK